MKNVIIRIMLFLIGVVGLCSIVWVGGFNFDSRSPQLAAVVIMSISFGAILACLPLPKS